MISKSNDTRNPLDPKVIASLQAEYIQEHIDSKIAKGQKLTGKEAILDLNDLYQQKIDPTQRGLAARWSWNQTAVFRFIKAEWKDLYERAQWTYKILQSESGDESNLNQESPKSDQDEHISEESESSLNQGESRIDDSSLKSKIVESSEVIHNPPDKEFSPIIDIIPPLKEINPLKETNLTDLQRNSAIHINEPRPPTENPFEIAEARCYFEHRLESSGRDKIHAEDLAETFFWYWHGNDFTARQKYGDSKLITSKCWKRYAATWYRNSKLYDADMKVPVLRAVPEIRSLRDKVALSARGSSSNQSSTDDGTDKYTSGKWGWLVEGDHCLEKYGLGGSDETGRDSTTVSGSSHIQ